MAWQNQDANYQFAILLSFQIVSDAYFPLAGCVADSLGAVAWSILEIQQVNVHEPRKQPSSLLAVVAVAVPHDRHVHPDVAESFEPMPQPGCWFTADQVGVPASLSAQLVDFPRQLLRLVFSAVLLPMRNRPVLTV